MVRFWESGGGEGGISAGVSKTASSCSSSEGEGEAGGLDDDIVSQSPARWKRVEMCLCSGAEVVRR